MKNAKEEVHFETSVVQSCLTKSLPTVIASLKGKCIYDHFSQSHRIKQTVQDI